MKTYTFLLAAKKVGAKTGLITCPAGVRSHWRDQIEDVLGTTEGWDIISYNGASDLEIRAKLRAHYDVWGGDEIHFCKSLDSQRSKAIFAKAGYGPGRQEGLARRAHYKWPLSGTITPNYRPVELWPMLKSMAPAFKDMSFGVYAQKYCGAFWDGRQLNVKGASRIDELAAILSDFMLRRTEAEVYPDRVKPLLQRIPVELTAGDMAAVIAAEDEIGGREARISSSYDKFSQLGDTSKLRRLLGAAKVRHIVSFVHDLLETVDKVVVFAHHRDVIAGLSAKLGYNHVIYQGGMTDAVKDYAKAKFINDETVRLFIGQSTAAGTGVDGLQKSCSTIVLAEPSWVPGDTDQWLRRLARTGQREALVKAYLVYAKGTLDGMMTQVHDRKESVGGRLMAGAPASPFDTIPSAWELF
jgi:SNF2 family DNA or RNA helicase